MPFAFSAFTKVSPQQKKVKRKRNNSQCTVAQLMLCEYEVASESLDCALLYHASSHCVLPVGTWLHAAALFKLQHFVEVA
jgi:hypothetical protein